MYTFLCLAHSRTFLNHSELPFCLILTNSPCSRSNLQLAILARSLPSYYLYTTDNKIQPSQFIGNKVAGILFENKIDHTTYFGANIEYVQGIHMLPLLPSTPLARSQRFVREEWDALFSNGRADAVEGGWRGVLYGNYATIDPAGAYRFFSSPGFNSSWLDGGASLTWYLAYSAGKSTSVSPRDHLYSSHVMMLTMGFFPS